MWVAEAGFVRPGEVGCGQPVFRSGHQRSLAVERGGLERANACSASLRVARCCILGGCTRSRSRIGCGILVCWFGNVRLGSGRVSSRSGGISRARGRFGIRRRGGCIGRAGCRGCVRLAGVRCRSSIRGGWRSGGLGGSVRCRGRCGSGPLIGRLGGIRLSSGISSRCCSAGCTGCRCGIRRRLGGGAARHLPAQRRHHQRRVGWQGQLPGHAAGPRRRHDRFRC